MRARVLLLSLGLVAVCGRPVPARAQQPEAQQKAAPGVKSTAKAAPGWMGPMLLNAPDTWSWELHGRDSADAHRQLQRLYDLVRGQPSLVAPNFWIQAQAWSRPNPGWPHTFALEFYTWPRGYRGITVSDALYIEANDIEFLLKVYGQEARKYVSGTGDSLFYQEPPIDSAWHGFPVMRDPGWGNQPEMRGTVIVTRRTKPLFRGVSVARFLRARIARERKDIPVNVPALERELAGLGPDERAADAYVGCDEGYAASGLCPPHLHGARRLVEPNPDFYDRSLPRSAAQLLLFFRERRNTTGRHKYASDAWNQALDSLDRSAVFALVK